MSDLDDIETDKTTVEDYSSIASDTRDIPDNATAEKADFLLLEKQYFRGRKDLLVTLFESDLLPASTKEEIIDSLQTDPMTPSELITEAVETVDSDYFDDVETDE